MLVIAQDEMYIGGTETLMLRLANCYISKGEKVRIYTREVDSQMEKEFLRFGIEVIKNKRWVDRLVEDVDGNSDTIFVVKLTSYLKVQSLLNKRKKPCNVFLYVTHTMDLYEFIDKRKIYTKLMYKSYRDMIKRLYDNGSLIFMDSTCVAWTENFYNIKFENIKENIWLIPMEVNPCDIEKVEEKAKCRKNRFNILTVARADFPAKGYIKSLIEDYIVAKKKYPWISLTSVSHGKDFDILKKWCEKDQSILLINGLLPDELAKEYIKSNLFFGVGTTILEAAEYCSLPVTVSGYTYEIQACRFFFEEPEHMCKKVTDTKWQNAEYYISKCIDMSDDDYYDYCIASRRAIEVHYDINKFYERLVERNLISQNVDISSRYYIQSVSEKLFLFAKKIKRCLFK